MTAPAANVAAAVVRLVAAGWVDDALAKVAAQTAADLAGLSNNGGEYVVMNVLTRGGVTTTIHQNSNPDDLGGFFAIITHPACAVVSGPNGEATCNPLDTDLVEVLRAQFH